MTQKGINGSLYSQRKETEGCEEGVKGRRKQQKTIGRGFRTIANQEMKGILIDVLRR